MVGSKDKLNPCAICGWAEHMAIHELITAGPKAGQHIGHAYVSELAMRNTTAKPEASASLFAQAAWFLADYAEMWFDIGPHEGEAEMLECYERCKEMIELARRLRELDGQWETKREAGSTASAAAIVSDMLKDWHLPGAVWWAPDRRRWRVTGDGYIAGPDEICVGVYAPGATAAMLQEDFEAVEAGKP